MIGNIFLCLYLTIFLHHKNDSSYKLAALWTWKNIVISGVNAFHIIKNHGTDNNAEQWNVLNILTIQYTEVYLHLCTNQWIVNNGDEIIKHYLQGLNLLRQKSWQCSRLSKIHVANVWQEWCLAKQCFYRTNKTW